MEKLQKKRTAKLNVLCFTNKLIFIFFFWYVISTLWEIKRGQITLKNNTIGGRKSKGKLNSPVFYD